MMSKGPGIESDVRANYRAIVDHYESCLRQHGDSHMGVDWPKLEDVPKRYKVMLEVMRQPDRTGGAPTLLDFGCGAGHLLEYMRAEGFAHVEYSGLDLSQAFVDLSRAKYPERVFHCVDVLVAPDSIPNHDYVVMNGVCTEKLGNSFDDMLSYVERLLSVLFSKTRVGIAVNFMSKHVDWERQDLFHLPFDVLAELLTRKLTRNYVFRSDYGLYEYTAYIYR